MAIKEDSFLYNVIIILTIVSMAGIILYIYVFKESNTIQVNMNYKDSYKIMNDASRIVLKGDADDINANVLVSVNGENTGQIIEKGFFDVSFILQSNNIEFFHIKYSYDDVGTGVTATQYTIFSNENKVIGYAEETVVGNDTDKGYVYLFYDANKKLKNYYLSTNNNYTIYSDKGIPLVTIEYASKNFFHEYTLYINTIDDGVDFQDKVFLFIRVLKKIKENNPQR